MEYGAITLDTSIFDKQGLKLETGLLKTLEQFNGKPYPFVLSEIVVREVHSHLKKKAQETRALANKAIRESSAYLSVTEDSAITAINALIPNDDDHEVAKNKINDFIHVTGAVIIPATERVKLDEIIKKYFNNQAPFAESGKKKNEFPDAIALMALESWAKENRMKILAVAKDSDWERFAEGSENIDVVEDLADAISKFQPRSAAMEFCKILARTLPNNEPADLCESLSDYLSHEIENIETHAEASSQFYFEPDIVEMSLDNYEFLTDDEGNALLKPIQGQNHALLVEAKINITANASTSFSLTVRDSIDKDYVPIGSSSATIEAEFEAEVLLTFEGDFEEGIEYVELTDLELLSYPGEINFGDVEPDWWYED